jgi:DNA-directed RNA polymerase specialized sigma24 family protein
VSAGDNTKDDRWRPGFASSERRVREELASAREPERRVLSRELSFVPAQARARFEPHDRQTRALIDEHNRRESLTHGPSVSRRLEHWRYLDAMRSPQEKQAYLEPLIEQVQQDAAAHEDVLIFLLLALEPIRRGISRRFVDVHGGIPHEQGGDRRDRAQERLIHEIHRETLYDVSREAIVQAIFLYPVGKADRLFPWFRTVASRYALFELRKDLKEDNASVTRAEAEAMQNALAGLDDADTPEMRDDRGIRRWRRGFNLRRVYEAVGDFYDSRAVREACSAAVGRLPNRQAKVIDGLFFQGHTPDELAIDSKVARSTIYNHTAKAKRNMHDDDCFYTALFQLGILRDQARAAEIAKRYPDGRLPDGRRIVRIDQAA